MPYNEEIVKLGFETREFDFRALPRGSLCSDKRIKVLGAYINRRYTTRCLGDFQ